MKILLTGATGYIGKRLLPELLAEGHEVVCCVRDKTRFNPILQKDDNIKVIEVDFLEKDTLEHIPKDIDAAYFLIHSMSSSRDYDTLELIAAKNFREAANATDLTQVIYLSGIVNEKALSKHLASRKAVEDELRKGNYRFTTLRAGIIIGTGSASFEIIKDLVNKLPIMVTPKWLNTKCQPIGVRDVISFLKKSLFNDQTFDECFDIGGPDIVTYKQMLEGYAEAKGLKRWIFIIPVMTPRLSSYWLYFITSTSYKLAIALVNSMKVEVICRDTRINELLDVHPMTYADALEATVHAEDTNHIISSWKDSQISGEMHRQLSSVLEIPNEGCFKDQRSRTITNRAEVVNKIWNIGGETGWYHSNFLWKIRGFIDQLFGGVGLRRGRSHPKNIASGDAIDFWRVLYANKEEGRLLLFAEMKLPGDAWLEFSVLDQRLVQTATFKPKGFWGKLYWYAVLPFHGIVFNGMIRNITR